MKHWPLIACIALILAGLGLAAANAVHKVRLSSENKSIATYMIRAAAYQYFLEHPERKVIQYDELIGPNCYIKAVQSVAGEDYHEMFPIPLGFRELAVTMADRRRIILFDGGFIHQRPDGSFADDSNPAVLADYQKWLADGKPLDTP